MKTITILLAALPLAACATTNAGHAPESNDVAMECNAEAVQNLIGHKATAAIGQQILSATNSSTLRWGPPNAAWTRDLRSDRVNISYDHNMVIERIRCG